MSWYKMVEDESKDESKGLKKIEPRGINVFFDYLSFFKAEFSDESSELLQILAKPEIKSRMQFVSVLLSDFYNDDFQMNVGEPVVLPEIDKRAAERDSSSDDDSEPENSTEKTLRQIKNSVTRFYDIPKTNQKVFYENLLVLLEKLKQKKQFINKYVYIKMGSTKPVGDKSHFVETRNASDYIMGSMYRLAYGVATFGSLPTGGTIIAGIKLAERINNSLNMLRENRGKSKTVPRTAAGAARAAARAPPPPEAPPPPPEAAAAAPPTTPGKKPLQNNYVLTLSPSLLLSESAAAAADAAAAAAETTAEEEEEEAAGAAAAAAAAAAETTAEEEANGLLAEAVAQKEADALLAVAAAQEEAVEAAAPEASARNKYEELLINSINLIKQIQIEHDPDIVYDTDKTCRCRINGSTPELFHVRYKMFENRTILTFVLHLGGGEKVPGISSTSAFQYRRHGVAFAAEFKDECRTFWVVDSLKKGTNKTVKKMLQKDVLAKENMSLATKNKSLNEKLPGLKGNCLFLAFDMCDEFMLRNNTNALTVGLHTIKAVYNKPGALTRRQTVGNSDKKSARKLVNIVFFPRLRF